MKTTGIIRKLDELGRVVIPVEIRNTLNIVEKDPIEISLDGSTILLNKHERNCIFCGNAKTLKIFKNKPICEECLKNIEHL